MNKRTQKKRGCLAGVAGFVSRLFFLLILLLALPIAINLAMVWTTQDQFRSLEDVAGLGAEAAIVFGAGLNPDGTPSPILAERLDTGIALYHAGACQVLLMSGDGSQDLYHNESRAMSLYAQAQGVPAQAIWEDPQGLSTRLSLERAQSDYRLSQVLLVSQRFHLTRALYLAQAQGMDAYGIASDQQDWSSQWRREIPARLKDFTRVQITRLPDALASLLLPHFDQTVETVKENQE